MIHLYSFQQNHWLQDQIERSIEGQTVGINDQNIELYNETIELYQTLVPLNQEVHKLRMKTQNLTNESYNINDVKVKKIIEDERQRLARELHDSVSQQLFAASMMLSAIKETQLEAPLDQQIPILEKNGTRFSVRDESFTITFKTYWIKRQIIR